MSDVRWEFVSDIQKLNMFGGCRKLYRVSVDGDESHIVADFAFTPDHGPETMLFRADAGGEVTDWMDLAQGIRCCAECGGCVQPCGIARKVTK